VEKFIDTPVKHYSNGMYLRLAFAVAAHLNPEILIVDEVLAVGDAAFQQKCLSRMGKVAKEGHTVLLVSHHLGTISSLCDNAVLLAKGRVVKTGPSVDVINNYHNELNDDGEDSSSSIQFAEDISLDAQILSAKMMDRYGKSKQQFDLFEPILVEIEYAIRKPIKGMVVEAYCINQGECLFASFDTDTCEERLRERETGIYKAIHQIPSPLLGAGHYELLYEIGILNVGLISKANRTVRFKVIEGSTNTSLLSCDTRNPGKLVVPIDWETSRIQGSKNA
jgi:lipopolysaccharide transport system ATP-binding protein